MTPTILLESKITVCLESTWSSLLSFSQSIYMSSLRIIISRECHSVSLGDLQSRSFRLWNILERKTLSIVTLSQRIFYLRAQINQASRWLILVRVASLMKGSIPTSNLDFTEPRKLLWEFHTQQLLTCGVLDASSQNYSQEFLFSQERVSKSNFPWSWKLLDYHRQVFFHKLHVRMSFSMIRQMSHSCPKILKAI